MTEEIDLVSDQQSLCGEAPTWDATNNRLLWVDIRRSLIFEHRLDEGQTFVISRDVPASGLALDETGRLVIAGSKGLFLRAADGRITTVLDNPDAGDYCFNDITAAPNGGLFAGSIHWGPNGMERTGHLYLIDPHGSVRCMDEGILHSNGLGLSPDNRTLYFVDTIDRKIFAYDVAPDDADLSNRRVLIEIPIEEGMPDGLAVDAEGFIWCAMWYGGQVLRFDPDGKLERRIPIPVKQVSSVAFGGPNLTDLYVTSAGDYSTSKYIPPGFDEKAPMGGALYRVSLSIQGKADLRCAIKE
jgi:D-xylonolactonase